MNDYITQALRTESTMNPDRLLHVALGLATEWGETWADVNHAEELGDLMWYVAIGADELELTLSELEELALEKGSMAEVVGLFSNQVKRRVFYGAPPDNSILAACLGRVIVNVKTLCDLFDLSYNEVLEQNITKLKRRYPDKFTADRAINR